MQQPAFESRPNGTFGPEENPGIALNQKQKPGPGFATDGMMDKGLEDGHGVDGVRPLAGRRKSMKLLARLDGDFFYFLIMTFLILNCLMEMFIVSFMADNGYPDIALYVLGGCAALYLLDSLLHIFAFGTFFLRSMSAVFDLVLSILMAGLVAARFVLPDYMHDDYNGMKVASILIFLILAALRLILKPVARRFALGLLQIVDEPADDLLISVESLRVALASFPGMGQKEMEIMDTQIVIACGRNYGFMSAGEFLIFLERALPHRPKGMTATEFLTVVLNAGMGTATHVYGTYDVIRSTLWHWSFQKLDIFLAMVVVVINAAVPVVQAQIIKFGTGTMLSLARSTSDSRDSQTQTKTLVAGCGMLVALTIPFVISTLGIGYYQSKMISNAVRRIQHQLADIILHQDNRFFVLHSEGDLNSLFTSDIARVSSLWQAIFWNLLQPVVTVIFILGYIYIVRWEQGIMGVLFIAVLISGGPQERASLESKDFASKTAMATAEFQNGLSCQRIIRAFGIFLPWVERFDVHCNRMRRSSIASQYWATVVQVYISGLVYFYTMVQVSAIWYAFGQPGQNDEDIKKREDALGTVTSLVALYINMSLPVITLGGFMRWAIGNAGSLQRLDEVLVQLAASDDADARFSNDHQKPILGQMENSLDLQNVTFRYHPLMENPSLNGVSMHFKKGTYTCICGTSGSGKSTILALLMGFYKPENGIIKIDDHDIYDFQWKSYMNRIAVVFQDIMVLNGTIMDNIRYGCVCATDEQCFEAARLAEIHEFIVTLPDGYDTIVGQHATSNLSGGQAQRICLARAIVRKPQILILDEATSALDPETESSIIKSIEKLAKLEGLTVISVTHRFQTTVNADMIYMLQAGNVVEEGTYRTLTEMKGGLFAEMAALQERVGYDALAPELGGGNGSFYGNQPTIADRSVLQQFSQRFGRSHRSFMTTRQMSAMDPDGVEPTVSYMLYDGASPNHPGVHGIGPDMAHYQTSLYGVNVPPYDRYRSDTLNGSFTGNKPNSSFVGRGGPQMNSSFVGVRPPQPQGNNSFLATGHRAITPGNNGSFINNRGNNSFNNKPPIRKDSL